MVRKEFASLGMLLCFMLISLSIGGEARAQSGITVGAIQTTAGPLAPFGREINAGLNDALMTANEDGGINGKKIKYVMVDGTYQPAEDKITFEKMLAAHNPLVAFGNSTELTKIMADEITKRFRVLYSGATFSSDAASATVHPSMFVPGPTYGDQMAMLLKYIAKEKPGATIAFVHSDTEFGRDPIKFGKLMCRRLRMEVVSEQVADIKGGDVGNLVTALSKANPDYVVLHGFLVSPVPEIIKQSRDLGMKCTFAGTFYGATEMLLEKLGPLAEGYLAINPYSYWWMEKNPTIKKIRDYTAKNYPNVTSRPIYYMQGYFTGMVFVECLKRADKAGKLNYDGLVDALKSLNEFDTGGLTPPVSIKNNRFPIGRVWRANVKKGVFEPVSEDLKLYD
ncbi:MAG: ABC transporter substrate-binding protein [Pseudomonadota bacterium]